MVIDLIECQVGKQNAKLKRKRGYQDSFENFTNSLIMSLHIDTDHVFKVRLTVRYYYKFSFRGICEFDLSANLFDSVVVMIQPISMLYKQVLRAQHIERNVYATPKQRSVHNTKTTPEPGERIRNEIITKRFGFFFPWKWSLQLVISKYWRNFLKTSMLLAGSVYIIAINTIGRRVINSRHLYEDMSRCV